MNLLMIVTSPDSDITKYAKEMLDAIQGGQYKLLAAMGLMGVVWALRKWVPWSWLKTDRGGAVLAIVGGAATGFAGALAAGATFSWGMLFDTLQMSISAAGGFALLKKLFAPSDQK